LWLTGGPGCSSTMAFLSENGPFQVEQHMNLEANVYSWNQEANMIWLESPAGVGFSYSNNTNDYTTGDARTAADTYTFLQSFFTYFPQYVNNEFWVTGESYGGHYVPEAAALIYKNNALGMAKINIVGMMVGNAWTQADVDNAGALHTWSQRALIPFADTDAALKACNLSDIGPLLADKMSVEEFAVGWQGFAGPACNQILNDISNTAFNDIDIYDIYIDVCNINLQQQMASLLGKYGSKTHAAMSRALLKHIDTKKRSVINPNPCIGTYLHDYMNLPAVQAAIHAIPTVWHMCSPVVSYNYKDVLTSVIPVYRYLINTAHAEILVYSGDVDAIVPYWGTQAWVVGLQLPIKEKWRAWHVNDTFGEQAGGFVVAYDGLTFATVRDAGHEVPFYQPKRGHSMFNGFLTSGRLPN